ncbi:LOW QUALITY PROTEIN: protein SIEL-like [Camellia sinensis]|uniref:LOW QUALITY PROTEIN: protein SIEL-like n=1 Tax=Camellia sinensis TaxID=4442 RepID=UPI001035FA55|nr:LOW QUALITY PROTEIN: protein SIEL-like [Camellia sinensis]
MEQQLGAKFEQILNEPTDASTSLQALSLARSLILNPSTSDSTISSLLQTLSLSLQPDRDPLSLRHTLSLLSDLAAHRRHLSQSIFQTVHSFSLLCNPTSTRTLAASLSVLASIAESNQTLASDLSELSESLFLKLCFFPSVSVRHWLLLNAERFWIRPPLLLTVFLGFTKDPYPYVRKVALDGLFGLCKSIVVEDCTLVESCYCRGVELLSDMEDCVRSSAVRAVAQWGQLLVALNHDDNKRDLSNALFIQLCSMVRDMNVKVRVEAFDALGEIGMVSEDILLQTLSKKVHSGIKGKTYPGLCSGKPFDIPASSAAGAILHGLEDEFCEVRRSACHAIQTLSILSADFSGEALTLLVDVLNDDSMVVRLQALETMRCMALFDHLKVQETHMHMFLSTLVDSSALVRSAARNVLRVIKLNDIAMFKLSVDGLLENLEMYPQDEADVFSVIFNIGRCHGNFAVDITERVSDEIEPSFGGKLGFDSRRVAALLVLAISAPLSNEQRTCSTPQRIFSYAVTLLGRISHALSDVMDQNTLLAYLSHCSSSIVISAAEFDFKKKEPFLPLEDGVPNNGACRSWKNVLATLTTGSSPGSIAFMLQYLRVVKLMAKIWLRFISPRKVCLYGMGEVGLLLGKLDTTLREMRYRFIGLSKEEELHVLELILLNFILRLSSVEVYYDFTTLKNLHSTLSRVEFLHEELSIQPSNFVTELKKSLDEIGFSTDGPFYTPFLIQKLVEFFSLKQFVFCGKLKHIIAELDVHDNDFENPFHFISGLPVGIPLEITLYNISRENRLWLQLAVDETLTEFVFLDLERFGGSNQIRKFTFVAPFYKTPKANSFSMRVYIGMECLSEDVYSFKRRGGPKRELVFLCKEKEVFLSMGVKE